MKIVLLLITISTNLLANDFIVSGEENFHFYGASESAQLIATTKAENICKSNSKRLSNWKMKGYLKKISVSSYACKGCSYQVKMINATASFKCL